MPETQEPVTRPTPPPQGGKGVERYDDAAQAGSLTRGLAHWIHEHPTFTSSNPVGYTAYQVGRSALASVPYGISMATTFLGMKNLGKLGKEMEELGKISGSGFKQSLGHNMHSFATFRPNVAAAMIGTSFTLYRGTSKLGKWANEYLFNPTDSEQETVHKLQHFPDVLWGKIKEVAPAELHSTPVAAIVLGYMTAAFDPALIPKALQATEANMKLAKAEGRGMQFFKETLFHPDAKLLQHSAINTFAYSLFFEMGDRRFKDKQMERGLWEGASSSISGSGSRANPGLSSGKRGDAAVHTDHATSAVTAPVQSGQEQPDTQIAIPAQSVALPQKGAHADDKLRFFTGEPSLGRFTFRRVLPTAIGITGYTAFKFRGAPMVLGDFKEGLNTIKDIPRAAWREGAATTLFFMIPFVTDKYVGWYDKVVDGLEGVLSGKKEHQPVIAPEQRDHIEKNQQKLLDRVNEKEKGAAVVASR